jgi:hypothetical protein
LAHLRARQSRANSSRFSKTPAYLGEWIAAQRRALAAGEAGAEERLIAAEHLRGELTKIIEGEPPGFSALVNYHRLCEPDGAGRRLLEKLRDSMTRRRGCAT